LTGLEQIVGQGTSTSCTVNAFRDALAKGGRISFNCGTEMVTLMIDETLTVIDDTAVNGGGLITLDGGGSTRILVTEAHSNVLLEGLTFTHGHSRSSENSTTASGSGGAVQRGWQSHLYLRNDDFIENKADGNQGFGGGALATDSSGWTTVVDCRFIGNEAPLGGAIHSLLSDLTIVNSRFERNLATGSDGGAIFTDGAYTPPNSEHGRAGGTIHLCGTTFDNNEAKASAGAGFLYAYGTDRLTINRCEFRGNSVSTADPGLGGAIRIDADTYLSNCLFTDNSTEGQGGAAWFGRGPIHFENVTFYANHATLWGGAISYSGVSTTLTNCTFVKNSAGENCGALFGDEGIITSVNSLYVNNSSESAGYATCRHPLKGTHNLVWPAANDDACGSSAAFIHEDPQIADQLNDEGGATNTLALGPSSPALDVGTHCPTTDQRGTPRDPDRCDLGAYER
jgi:predicted outer membrane repeat protein